MGHEATAVNKQMMNALHMAVEEEHAKCVKEILLHTVDNETKKTIIKARDINNENPLMIAIKKRKKEIIKILIDEHKDFGIEQAEKMEIINFCAEFGNIEIMKSFYEDFRASQRYVDSSLHFAIRSNQEEIVKFLLKKGANVNHKDEENDILPLEFAVRCGHSRIVSILRKEKNLK